MENLLQGYGDDAFPYPFEDRFPKENSSFAHRLKTVNSSVDPRPSVFVCLFFPPVSLLETYDDALSQQATPTLGPFPTVSRVRL